MDADNLSFTVSALWKGWPGMRFPQPSLLMKLITYQPAQQKVSQPPSNAKTKKKRAPFFRLGALHVGWDNLQPVAAACLGQAAAALSCCSWRLGSDGSPPKNWASMFTKLHKIAQGWSMNLSRGARVSMSSLIYDQTPLIKGKAIQFYHLLLGEPPNTPTTQWDPIGTHSNDIYKLSFFQQ